MVGGSTPAFEELDRPGRPLGDAGEHLEEVIPRHRPGTGAGHEDAPGLEQSHGHAVQVKSIGPGESGLMNAVEYDRAVGDLVSYLVYMGEPWKVQSGRVGIIVMFFLSILLVFVYLLKLEFWRDIKH